MSRSYYVYILTNRRRTVLYTGVTNNLRRRVREHKAGHYRRSFTRRYSVDQLVYFEVYTDARTAIAREKQIKAGTRRRKVALINRMNPGWHDLSEA